MDRRVFAAVLRSGYGGGGNENERSRARRKKRVSNRFWQGIRVEERKETYFDDDTGVVCR